MQLKGVSITSRNVIHAYFDYAQLFGIICSKTEAFLRFSETLYGEHKLEVDRQAGCLVRKYRYERSSNPFILETLAMPDGQEKTWILMDDQIRVRCDADRLCEYLTKYLYGDIFPLYLPYDIPPQLACSEDYSTYLHDVLQPVYENNIMELDTAWKLMLVLYLHLQAYQLIPDELITRLFDQNDDRTISTSADIILTEDCILPFFIGGEYTDDDKLEIVKLTNGAEHAIRITIADTVLHRIAASGQRIWALRICGRYVGFLPRFTVCSGNVGYINGGCFTWESPDGESIVDAPPFAPVSWAQCNRHGKFFVSSEGSLHGNAANVDSSAVLVKSAGNNYCVILDDGTPRCYLPQTSWTRILDCSLSVNAGIAIDWNRRVTELGGTAPLDGNGAIQAACGGGHYIWLDSDGTVHADTALERQDAPAEAAAIWRDKFAVLENSVLYIYNSRGMLSESIPVFSNDGELYADSTSIAVYDIENNYARFITPRA